MAVSDLQAQLITENWIGTDAYDFFPPGSACQKPKSKHVALDSTENHKEQTSVYRSIFKIKFKL